jgi:hypothetical protein
LFLLNEQEMPHAKAAKAAKDFQNERLIFFFAVQSVSIAVFREAFTTDGTDDRDENRAARIHFRHV